MGKRLQIMLLSILFTGCFSYKKTNLAQSKFNKEDICKITTVGRDTKKGKFHSLNDSLLVLKSRRGYLYEIRREEIQEIKRRKFSLGRTIALPAGIHIGLIGVALSLYIGSTEYDFLGDSW